MGAIGLHSDTLTEGLESLDEGLGQLERGLSTGHDDERSRVGAHLSEDLILRHRGTVPKVCVTEVAG